MLTISALVLATAAELLLPIVMKLTLDDHLLRRENRLSIVSIEAAATGEGPLELTEKLAADLLKEGFRIGDSLFVPSQALSDLHSDERAAAVTAGWLDAENWYVVTNPDDDALNVINGHADDFIRSVTTDTFAIRISDRDNLTTDERRALRSGDIAGLKSRSLQYFLLLFSVLIFTFVQVYQASWIGQKIMADIRQGLLGHIMRQSLKYLGQTPVGSLVSRTANDVETINEFFTNVTISFLKDGAIMIGVIAVLFALDSRLALVALVTMVPTFILIAVFQNRMRESFRRVRAKVSSVNAYLSERLGGMSTVQLFDTEKRSGKEFDVKGDELLDAELGQMKIMAVFRPLIDLIASVAVALIIWYSTGLHDSGLLTLGVLIAFIELIQKFFQPVKDIAEKFNILQSAMAGGERIFAMMDIIDRIPDGGNDEAACDEEPVCGEIIFEDVHFSYVPGEPVLKGLNFRIEPGQTVAVVGATGAGKTTIANLITRLWDPDEGRVLLDGKDVRNRPLPELRRSVQPVQQDVFLFAGTIAENIDLGLGLSKEKIIEAARISR
ncbi:MAG: ATP-binding cassette domain-containing protein, partial [Spirochaetaceae bacterium]|nr:ATP-binding cassette domain-containing protein [Spirochaetaceae bacterium]